MNFEKGLERYYPILEGIIQDEEYDGDYQSMCDDMKKICNSQLVILNLFNDVDNTLHIKGISSSKENINTIKNILNGKFVIKDINFKYIKSQIFNDESIVFLDNTTKIFKIKNNYIENLKYEMNFENIYILPLEINNDIKGFFIIGFYKNKKLIRREIIKIFLKNFSYIFSKIEREKKLRIKEKICESALKANDDDIWIWNVKENKVLFTTHCNEVIEYRQYEMGNNFEKWIKFIHQDDLEKIYNCLDDLFYKKIQKYKLEYRLKWENDVYINCLSRGKVIKRDKNGKPIIIIGTHNDVTSGKKIYEKIMYLSFHDKLTGLYNRAFFEEELKRFDTQRQLPLSIIMGDANGLKLINDAFGHDMGDKLIKKIAEVLKKCCREEDIIARIGGDEFIIMLPNVTQKEALCIVKRIGENCKIRSDEFIMANIALGTATKIVKNENVYEICKLAEEMMYKNKLNQSKKIKEEIVDSLTKILEKKQYREKKDNDILIKICVEMGKILHITSDGVKKLKLLVNLYDIGKIAIPKKILNKRGKLDNIEWKIVKRHCETGYRIATASTGLIAIADFILSHHEYYNGKGYPQGLKEKGIPLYSRIIAVIDAYNSMVSHKPYRKAKSTKEALHELNRCSGTQFDPEIVKVFEKALNNVFVKEGKTI